MYSVERYICEVDEKEFEDEDECLKYELTLKYGDVIKNNELQLWDNEFQPMSITDIEHSLEYAMYFKCLTEAAANYMCGMAYEFGYCGYPYASDVKLGELYVFDEDDEEFVSFSVFSKRVIEIAKAFNLKLEE